VISTVHRNRSVWLVIALLSIAAFGLYRSVVSSTSKPTKPADAVCTNPLADQSPVVAVDPLERKASPTQPVTDNTIQHQTLVGTWLKVRTEQEGGHYDGDDTWQLSVTFDAKGRFFWDSTRYEDGQAPLEESVTGAYVIERGFIITYLFDKPSPTARQRLPELFAFWPNRLRGQQTFRFHNDYLILGHDAQKLWIHLKRKSEQP